MQHTDEWRRPFDICGFHFISIVQAEIVLMFLNYRGEVKLITTKMGYKNRVVIDNKLGRLRRDNNLNNNIHMVMRLIGHTGFWNRLDDYLKVHKDQLKFAKQQIELHRQLCIKRRKS